MIDQQLKDNFIKSYDAQSYNRNRKVNPEWKDAERETFLGWLREEGKESLLDLGAGPGLDSLFFKQNGIDPLAIDISAQMVKLCSDKGIQAKVMSFDELHFEKRRFDAVWSMNSLLHVPKKDIDGVLKSINEVLTDNGLFYLGLYGGKDHEGVWEDDAYEPKRFFAFHSSASIQKLVAKYFTIENFIMLPPEIVESEYAFQSLLLRKKKE
ncbi:class I SAM-dependent methyltransferase [Bacillus sp. SCS-153A]|uniref:class I SAM-dependent methyltransferase n=1 Tax=Rossellomorea sedimentorum TaxID=3115294 RepID=UPI003905D1E4